ncbi:unknown [Neodiprion lecontei nucleopolyhedrovirus]|uniref:RNA 2'-phosphotransferase n=1 Tax=Neodiprion lecontei nucleopolyhedrovirus (strain Canada) TaxID=654906 RepID=Q6JP78_NPVNC|nr:unknown [Neodiprion lecontei nucleopolyhedrovirus]AAQ99103.1 unknown [Neodiprion lecontei nucleopolyhedrovirus]
MSYSVSKNAETQISKSMCYLLRHDKNFVKRSDGFVSIDTLAEKLNIDKQRITEIAHKDSKNRYEINNSMIRAVQGHSNPHVIFQMEKVNIDYDGIAVHGTFKKHLNSIMLHGLKRMSRNHIHLGTSKKNARKNAEVFVYIDIQKCLKNGILFHFSSNGYILTTGIDGTIPSKYISKYEFANDV